MSCDKDKISAESLQGPLWSLPRLPLQPQALLPPCSRNSSYAGLFANLTIHTSFLRTFAYAPPSVPNTLRPINSVAAGHWDQPLAIWVSSSVRQRWGLHARLHAACTDDLLPPFLPLAPSYSQDLSWRQTRRGSAESGERAGRSQGALFLLPLLGYRLL